MKFLNKLIALPESDGAGSEEDLDLLKDMRSRVKKLEKHVCGETLEEAVKNGSIKGKKAREIRERLDVIAEYGHG